jgi:hypothetical protein
MVVGVSVAEEFAASFGRGDVAGLPRCFTADASYGICSRVLARHPTVSVVAG